MSRGCCRYLRGGERACVVRDTWDKTASFSHFVAFVDGRARLLTRSGAMTGWNRCQLPPADIESVLKRSADIACAGGVELGCSRPLKDGGVGPVFVKHVVSQKYTSQ